MSIAAEKIVKDYFDNTLIIDDKLDLHLLSQNPCAEIKSNLVDKQKVIDEQLGGLKLSKRPPVSGDTPGKSITLAVEPLKSKQEDLQENLLTIEDPDKKAPLEAYKAFAEDGFLTMPWEYTNNPESQYKQSIQLKTTLANTKLLIVDWNLENSTTNVSSMGSQTLKILSDFTTNGKGLRCAVIYTKEDISEVQNSLSQVYIEGTTDKLYKINLLKEKTYGNTEKILSFEEEKDSKCLFGFVFHKTISPKEIITVISKYMLKEKIITLHFMESATLLDQHVNQALTEFNAPFEKVLLTQMVTSEMSDNRMATFFNETLLSTLLSQVQSDTRNNFLLDAKKQHLINLIEQGIDETKALELIKYLKINEELYRHVLYVLSNSEFQKSLKEALSSVTSFDALKKCLVDLVTKCCRDKSFFEKEKNRNHLFLFFILLEYYKNSSSKEEFVKNYKNELYRFTKLLKYIDTSHDEEIIQNGSILVSGNRKKYLLCITPVCDVARLEKVNNKHKFIVGEVIEKVDKKSLSESQSNHVMAIPDEQVKKIIFVRWNFFDTITMESKDLLKEDAIYRYTCTLKRDYIQKVISLYTSYQSRAGVEELFYKESSYNNNFLSLIE